MSNFSETDKLRLELGLHQLEEELLNEDELQYFLDKHKGNLRKAGLDAAKTLLFGLSSRVHERTGVELEIWGHTWFENYMQALKMYMQNPNFNMSFENAKAYAGGISRADIEKNNANTDTVAALHNSAISTDYLQHDVNTDQVAFTQPRNWSF